MVFVAGDINDLFVYDTTTGVWTEPGNVQGPNPVARMGLGFTPIKNVFYLFGGGAFDSSGGCLSWFIYAKTQFETSNSCTQRHVLVRRGFKLLDKYYCQSIPFCPFAKKVSWICSLEQRALFVWGIRCT